jgi:phosphoenolpyruvate carboxykinase (ATP)
MNKKALLKPDLSCFGLNSDLALFQLSIPELISSALNNGEGLMTDSGALAINTGKFTGRSPRDRFIVCDEITEHTVFWGDVNFKFEKEDFNRLQEKITAYLNRDIFYVRDAYACAHTDFKMRVKVITETAYQSLFAHHLFLRLADDQDTQASQINIDSHSSWTIIAAPGFNADPGIDGTRQSNFSILNFTKRMILIGGTGYTGEIKKGIFSVLNFILPHNRNTLSMHCSANVGKAGDTALFFGLSGTGKTTLSADPERALIGDDEHGWSDDAIFNLEGGCYAKCVDLSPENEPQIYSAIQFGALLENVSFFPNTNSVNFSNVEKTENTRVAYPLTFVKNSVLPSIAPAPKNIFFLTADAFGVLPPISKLSAAQAMYHFLSGYTAKVAGTETGVTEPQTTFSACFGKAFLPLHPSHYTELFGNRLKENKICVWLVNTGWTGGAYGTGTRMKLNYTRAMIKAALVGDFDSVTFDKDSVFGLAMPESCPGVPSKILNPRNTWADPEKYDLKAAELAEAFRSNFKQFETYVDKAVLGALPTVETNKLKQ